MSLFSNQCNCRDHRSRGHQVVRVDCRRERLAPRFVKIRCARVSDREMQVIVMSEAISSRREPRHPSWTADGMSPRRATAKRRQACEGGLRLAAEVRLTQAGPGARCRRQKYEVA